MFIMAKELVVDVQWFQVICGVINIDLTAKGSGLPDKCLHPCTSDICRATTVPCRAIVKKFTHASFSRTISSDVNNFLDEKYSIHIAASLHYEL